MPRLETQLAHAGARADKETAAVTAPIHLSTTFERAPDGSYPTGNVYSRWGNPTRDLFASTVAKLENGESALAFSSGMGAIDTLLRTLAPGERVLFPEDVYHATRQVVREILSRHRVGFDQADFSSTDAVRTAIRAETGLVWIETPSNPLCKIYDIAAITDAAHASGVEVVADNTWATPLLQRPIDLGVDYVIHSATKYLSGHSDVLAGVLVTKIENERFAQCQAIHKVAGAVASPFDAWLTLRGMRSLGARMPLHCDNAEKVVQYLVSHKRVSRVFYPGLTEHRGHEVARKQMTRFGAMLSFLVDGDESDALRVTGRVRTFIRATSLGGTESLIEHRASIESKPTDTPVNLLRLSIGLENTDDLLEDLERALE